MKIIIGADHAGVDLKEKIIAHLKNTNHKVEDVGTNSKESVDYPDYAKKVAQTVKEENCTGILICGTGIGMSITANKVKGIRAALCYSDYTAKVSREHNNANILCIGARTTKDEEALSMVDIFLSTNFSEEERHHKRVDKMNELDTC